MDFNSIRPRSHSKKKCCAFLAPFFSRSNQFRIRLEARHTIS